MRLENILFEAAVTAPTTVFFVCFIQPVEYCAANLLLPACLCLFAENGRNRAE